MIPAVLRFAVSSAPNGGWGTAAAGSGSDGQSAYPNLGLDCHSGRLSPILSTKEKARLTAGLKYP